MRSDHLLLEDILDAIDEIRRYLPADRDAFDSDRPLQSHIYRHIMIVGEAAYRLSTTLKERHPETPWRLIEGMRHVLVHDYFQVDWDEVYRTAAHDIPKLQPQIQDIADRLAPETDESA